LRKGERSVRVENRLSRGGSAGDCTVKERREKCCRGFYIREMYARGLDLGDGEGGIEGLC